MSTQDNKNSIKKFLSLAGVAGASVFLSCPVLAQTNPDYSSRANSTVRSTELLAQAISDYQESPLIVEATKEMVLRVEATIVPSTE
jgi:hypothetical protein